MTDKPVDFFQRRADHFDRKEFEELVSDIKWGVEYDIPGGRVSYSRDMEDSSPDHGGEEELVVVLEWGEDGLPEQEVCQDAAGEDDQHGGGPQGQRVFPGEGQGAWGRGLTQISHQRPIQEK